MARHMFSPISCIQSGRPHPGVIHHKTSAVGDECVNPGNPCGAAGRCTRGVEIVPIFTMNSVVSGRSLSISSPINSPISIYSAGFRWARGLRPPPPSPDRSSKDQISARGRPVQDVTSCRTDTKAANAVISG